MSKEMSSMWDQNKNGVLVTLIRAQENEEPVRDQEKKMEFETEQNIVLKALPVPVATRPGTSPQTKVLPVNHSKTGENVSGGWGFIVVALPVLKH